MTRISTQSTVGVPIEANVQQNIREVAALADVIGPLNQNARIAAFPQRRNFVAGEVAAPRVASNDTAYSSLTWEVDDGQLVTTNAPGFSASQVYFDVGKRWEYGQSLEVGIEFVLGSGGTDSGGCIVVGDNPNRIVFFYGQHGALAVLDTSNSGITSVNTGLTYAVGEKVRLDVVITKNGIARLTATDPSGQIATLTHQVNDDVRGLVAPALRKGVTLATFHEFYAYTARVSGDEFFRLDSDFQDFSAVVSAAISGIIPGAISGPLLLSTGLEVDTPTATISVGQIVVNNDQVGNSVRYWDVGVYWDGVADFSYEVEVVRDDLTNTDGPAIAIHNQMLLYSNNGVIGLFNSGGGTIDVVSTAATFGVGDVARLHVVFKPGGSAVLTARNITTGQSATYTVTSIPTSGVVAPAVRRAGARVIRVRDSSSLASRLGDVEQELPVIDGRLTALEAGGAGNGGSAPALKPLSQALVLAGFNHILLYGQSNSIGADAVPVISTSQPYSNVTFHGGVAAWDGSAFDYAPYIPLIEADGINGGPGGAGVPLGETPCSGAANYATTLRALDGHDPAEHVILASTAGRGSRRIDELNKGTSWYSNTLIPMIQAAVDIDPDYACHVMCWVQGERDADVGTAYASYLSQLEALQSDVEADIQGVSGQDGPVYMLVGQVTAYARSNDGPARAMTDAARGNDKIFVIYPSYRIPYDTNIHYSNVGAKLVGAYFGRAYKQMVDGFQPDTLMPISATLRDSRVRVRFDVPHLPLRLDTAALAATTDYGFQVTDDGDPVTISGIELDGTDVLITLADPPSGVLQLRYGLDYAGSGRSVSGGAEGCGNLRDSAPETITILGNEYQLFNAAPAFALPIFRLGE